jgi:hypothetical protein
MHLLDERTTARVARLRKLAAECLKERRRRRSLLPPDPPPRYDELWKEAMARLEPSFEAEDLLVVVSRDLRGEGERSPETTLRSDHDAVDG